MDFFAHSLPGRTEADGWEPLDRHLTAVGARAAEFAEPFGASPLARAAGLLHDIGKCATEYQDYIRGARPKGPDHSTAGARAACAEYGKLGRLLAFGIAGHHSGLMEGSGRNGKGRSLADRLASAYAIPAHDGWRDHVIGLPTLTELLGVPRPNPNANYPGFEFAFLARMLFSCLVDADFLETERFYAEADNRPPPTRGGTVTRRHLERIRSHMAGHRKDDTPVNRLRSEILDHAVAKATEAPGLFTLTVPTGGGKTLASLSFALEHALAHDLQRVVYVIPFTSIIEQTADVFRQALDAPGDVLEHHASFDWDRKEPGAEDDQEKEGAAGLAKLRRDAENWDAPIIVTTAVQFFESLFAARPSRARKLHNLAKSVVILDEAQTLPVHLLRPSMAALDELCRNYGASVVLCTATQPALRKIDGALKPKVDGGPAEGFDIDDARELAPRPRALYQALKRVEIEWRHEPVTDAEIAERFAAQDRMLVIVNSRAHARDLFEAIRDLPGARHLTTLMCAKHRRALLAEVRAELGRKRPVRLVATSLIEAGVDVDFPEVWRAAAGLDSIAQAAGRCNREGRLEGLGRTVAFEPAGRKIPPAIEAFWQAARPVLRQGGDPLGLDAVHRYFRELYFQKGHDALDRAILEGSPFPIIPAISNTVQALDFPFARIAAAFRLIDDVMEPVLVPWDEAGEAALHALEHADRPPAGVLRKLQQYIVPVPAKARAALLATGAAQAIRPEDYGDRFVRLTSLSHYDPALGLRLDDPAYRASESNIFS